MTSYRGLAISPISFVFSTPLQGKSTGLGVKSFSGSRPSSSVVFFCDCGRVLPSLGLSFPSGNKQVGLDPKVTDKEVEVAHPPETQEA